LAFFGTRPSYIESYSTLSREKIITEEGLAGVNGGNDTILNWYLRVEGATMSWTSIFKWLTHRSRPDRLREIDLLLSQIAKKFDPKPICEQNGELGLIVTPPFALLLHFDGGNRHIQPYCAVIDEKSLDLNTAMRFRFHQRGEIPERMSWVWFPRLSPAGATCYKIQRHSYSRYECCVERVKPAIDSCLMVVSHKSMIAELSATIVRDFRESRLRLQAELARV
jgi:hypothetical protein